MLHGGNKYPVFLRRLGKHNDDSNTLWVGFLPSRPLAMKPRRLTHCLSPQTSAMDALLKYGGGYHNDNKASFLEYSIKNGISFRHNIPQIQVKLRRFCVLEMSHFSTICPDGPRFQDQVSDNVSPERCLDIALRASSELYPARAHLQGLLLPLSRTFCAGFGRPSVTCLCTD